MNIMQNDNPDGFTAEESKRLLHFKHAEYLAHILPYEKSLDSATQKSVVLDGTPTDINDKQINITDEDGVEREYNVHRIKTDNEGLVSFVLYSDDHENPRVHVLFRGTHNKASARRDLETVGFGPGSYTFNENQDEILRSIKAVVKHKQQDSAKAVVLSVAGHSLGGADAQMCATVILEDIAKHSENNPLAKIGGLNIMHANAAGVTHATAKKAKDSLTAIRSNGSKLKISQHIIHVAGDAVQQGGYTSILSKASSEDVDTNFIYAKVETKYYKLAHKILLFMGKIFPPAGLKHTYTAHTAVLLHGKSEHIDIKFTIHSNQNPEDALFIRKRLEDKTLRKSYKKLKRYKTIATPTTAHQQIASNFLESIKAKASEALKAAKRVPKVVAESGGLVYYANVILPLVWEEHLVNIEIAKLSKEIKRGDLSSQDMTALVSALAVKKEMLSGVQTMKKMCIEEGVQVGLFTKKQVADFMSEKGNKTIKGIQSIPENLFKFGGLAYYCVDMFAKKREEWRIEGLIKRIDGSSAINSTEEGRVANQQATSVLRSELDRAKKMTAKSYNDGITKGLATKTQVSKFVNYVTDEGTKNITMQNALMGLGAMWGLIKQAPNAVASVVAQVGGVVANAKAIYGAEPGDDRAERIKEARELGKRAKTSAAGWVCKWAANNFNEGQEKVGGSSKSLQEDVKHVNSSKSVPAEEIKPKPPELPPRKPPRGFD